MQFHIGSSGACRHPDKGHGRSREIKVSRRRALHREQHGDHRIASGKTRGSDLVDDLFKWQLLVLVRTQSHLADMADQLREPGGGIDPGTQRNCVHEQPDERRDPVVFPIRHRSADHLII